MVPATAVVQSHCVWRWFSACHSGFRPLPASHACALGQSLHRDLFQVLEGKFGQSLPSGLDFPEAAGKPVTVFTVVSLGPSGIQGCLQFSWMILLVASFLLLGLSEAGCSLQCTVGEAGLHCASQLGREVILIHLHPPPQHFLLHTTLFRVAPLRCSLRPPDSVSFIFLSCPGPGDKWGMETKQVPGGDRRHRRYGGGRAPPTGRNHQTGVGNTGPQRQAQNPHC